MTITPRMYAYMHNAHAELLRLDALGTYSKNLWFPHAELLLWDLGLYHTVACHEA